MSDYDVQSRIMHQSNVMRDTIAGLMEWEKEMKQKEAQRVLADDSEGFDQSHPIRSHVQQSAKIEEIKRKVSSAPPTIIEKANEFKTRGNDCVKSGQYEKAIRYYTEAIRLNKSEAVYFTNRALCYLKQNKHNESIDDCTAAIRLDSKAVKAYYRRMQAQEQMENGDITAALKDCEMVLKLEPKNVDAQRSLERIRKRLPTIKTKTESQVISSWSQYENTNGYEKIDFISKSPHLRSKQPLKRIAINDGCGKKAKMIVELSGSSSSEETKLIENVKPKNASHTSTNDQTVQSVKPFKLEIPKTSTQFYKIWLSLNNIDHKFQVLKGISTHDVSKLLGAQLNLNIVREIFTILRSFFVKQKLTISNILSGVANNSEMQIIAVMMNADDKDVLASLFDYMLQNGEDQKKIIDIRKSFDEHFAA